MSHNMPHTPRPSVPTLALRPDFSAAVKNKTAKFCEQLMPRLADTYSRPSKQGERIAPYGVHMLREEKVVRKGKDYFLREAKRLLREVDIGNGKGRRIGKLVGIGMVPVKFEWEGKVEGCVFLAGSFNEWGLPMAMTLVGERWECVIRLAVGVYDYKFVIDGEWAVDTSRLCAVVQGRGVVNRVIVEGVEPS